jgi:hypothetical protein
MFQPYRFGFWWRMAVLGLFTGELSGGGGGGGNFPSNFSNNHGGGHAGTHSPFPGDMSWFTPTHILEIAIGFALFILVFSLIFSYINAILRFVLFDAVLHGNVRIREGWRKWRETGRKYFVWLLILALVGWGSVFLFIVIPLFLLFSNHHIGFWHIDATAILVLVLCGMMMVAFSIAVSIVMVLTKDFVVPIMALDGVGWQEGWHRFRAIAAGHASEYFIYFLMKIVLRIGAGIAHGIVVLIVAFILIIPTVIAVVAGVAIGAGATTVVKALLITIGIVGGLILVGLLIAISALAGAPIAFFFPSYAIYFFAGRYEPLGRIVFPAPPPPAPPPVFVPSMPEPPPMPA